jgi:hypothetical protein
MAENETEAAALAWADYRKDYGVNSADMTAAHKAFLAGWQARAGELDAGGVQR